MPYPIPATAQLFRTLIGPKSPLFFPNHPARVIWVPCYPPVANLPIAYSSSTNTRCFVIFSARPTSRSQVSSAPCPYFPQVAWPIVEGLPIIQDRRTRISPPSSRPIFPYNYRTSPAGCPLGPSIGLILFPAFPKPLSLLLYALGI